MPNHPKWSKGEPTAQGATDMPKTDDTPELTIPLDSLKNLVLSGFVGHMFETGQMPTGPLKPDPERIHAARLSGTAIRLARASGPSTRLWPNCLSSRATVVTLPCSSDVTGLWCDGPPGNTTSAPGGELRLLPAGGVPVRVLDGLSSGQAFPTQLLLLKHL
jgi:hypothetical protein